MAGDCRPSRRLRPGPHNLTDDLEDRAIVEAERVEELKELFDTDYRSIILDLREVRLADRDAVKFLKRCEADGMKLQNVPAYVREWMEREKD